MDFEKLIQNITPEIYISLKRGVELGKWPDGRVLSEQQKELCMEAVIKYEQQYVDEQNRVGYIDRGSKQEGEKCNDNVSAESSQAAPLKWH